MRIALVDGNPDAGNTLFGERLALHGRALSEAGHTVELIRLQGKTIHWCTGCFSCWVKTPGICVFKDDQTDILRSFLNSDVVVFASPLFMGFYSALLKKTIDRVIPLIIPYIEFADGECRHPLRYDSMPRMAFLYEREEDTDEEDIGIVSTAFERFARNGHTKFLFARPLGDDSGEVRHAIEHL
jgi:multimeric flavodoxin WrbA